MIAALLLAVSLEAQQHFSAGLRDLYAYASEPAAAEFKAAAKADPTYALARWGEALALGSDLNTPLTAERFAAAHNAIAFAQKPAANTAPRDAALIAAATLRYAGSYADRLRDEKSYRVAMESDLAIYPDDDDAAMILVEDLLEQHGMTWGEDGKPLGDTSAEILSLLDRTLARSPRHLFANHLCIHAYDNAPDRTPAIACAQVLDSMTFVEPMEHLAHMPAHVWLELGDGKAALRSSERAWTLNPTRYAEHDAYVAYAAAMMCGNIEAQANWSQRLGAAQGEHVPSDLPPFVYQAKALEGRGEVDAAVALLEQNAEGLANAREMLPLFPADVRIGAVYFRAARYREALAAFQRVLVSRPRDPRALYGLSEAYSKLGDVAQAAKARAASATYWAGDPLTMNEF